jgi:hypothetical protein
VICMWLKGEKVEIKYHNCGLCADFTPNRQAVVNHLFFLE